MSTSPSESVPPPYGYAPPTYVPPPVPPSTGKRQVKVWDLVLTIVFLVGDVALTAIMSFAGLFLSMASDSCSATTCDYNLISTAMIVGIVMPWVVLVVTIIAAIVLLVLRRLAFWVPLLGAALIVASLAWAFALAAAGVPSP